MIRWRNLWQIHKKMCYLRTNYKFAQSSSAILSSRCFCSKAGRADLSIPLTSSTEDDINLYMNLETIYTSDQQALILNVLNDSSLEELLQYAITKARASNIIKYRNKHGHFRNVNTVLEVEGIGAALLEKLCENIAYGTGVTHSSITKRKKSVCLPKITEELRKMLTSVVSIRIQPTQVMYLHLQRDMKILKWGIIPITLSFNNPAYRSLKLVDDIINVLPHAEAYLMEQRSSKVRSLQFVSSLCSLVQFDSMLMAKLNIGDQHVFIMKDNAVASFFNLRLGNENISGKKVVEDILNGVHCVSLRNVLFEEEKILDWYKSQLPAQREELGNCLLNAIAFYEVGIVNR